MTGTASDIAAVSADIDLPGDPAGHRVVVAMSGGVDSSVTAALLARAGFEVVGITLQLYDHGAATGRKGACCAGQDIHDAARVAERLGIPHYVLDYESRFREAVIEDFAESYRRGETPIPCIRCNERIKFRDLLETARDLGADALATGHYVRRVAGPRRPGTAPRPRSQRATRAISSSRTTRAELDFLRFPLGGLAQGRDARAGARVRPAGRRQARQPGHLLRAAGLLCRHRRRGCGPEAGEPGDIVDRRGRVLGRHHGHRAFHGRPAQGARHRRRAEPLYVLRLDPETRRVVVGPRDALGRDARFARRDELARRRRRPRARMPVPAKLRSAQPPVPATAAGRRGDGDAELVLDAPAGAVAPGQAAVLYDGDRVLGGGWIRRRPGRRA